MRRSAAELRSLLDALRSRPENEVVEFKAASRKFDLERLGKYVSALANEANLGGVDTAWLLFGVNDNGDICGTSYRELPGQLESLKHEIAQHLTAGHGFLNAYEIPHRDGRVLMLEVPPSPAGMPIAWNGQCFARNGESLTSLSVSKLDEIRRQVAGDWSAETIQAASVEDLDEAAVAAARVSFAAHHPRVSPDDINAWSTEQFLERAGLTLRGKLTRACIVLLGTDASARLLGQTMPEVTWILSGEERVYEHFGLPFFTVGDRVYDRIRNYQIRLLQPGALIQTEVSKYDPQSILEALHNCVAHMDYREGARVTLIEHPDRLVLDNAGEFYDGEPSDYVLGERQARKYRNPLLVQAMTKLNMIDRIGYGIAKMSRSQAQRFLPLPDYDLDPKSVRLTIYGAEIDKKYSELLMQHTDLDIADVFALDRVQKGMPVPADAVKRLRRASLIEGRAPNLHISVSVASATGSQAEYMRVRSIEDEYYVKMILDYLEKFGSTKRTDIEAFLWDKLHASLSDDQKRSKVHNLLAKVRVRGQIESVGASRAARWQIAKNTQPN